MTNVQTILNKKASAVSETLILDNHPKMPQSSTTLNQVDGLNWMPIQLLRLFGFLPISSKNCFQNFFCNMIAVLHLLGGYMACLIQLLKGIEYVHRTSPEVKGNSGQLVKTMSIGQYFVEFMRAIIVLTLFFSTRKAFVNLSRAFKNLTIAIFPNDQARTAAYKQWKKLAAILSVITLTMHLAMETAGWLPLMGNGLSNIISQNITTFQKNVSSAPEVANEYLAPIPKPLYYSTYYFEALLFCLSQQVLVIVVVFAFALRSFIKINNIAILKLREDLQEISNQETEDHVRDAVQQRTFHQLETIRRRHWDILLYSQQLNSFFGKIILIAYGMDLISALGFLASAILNILPLVAYHVYAGFSIVFIGSYITVFYWPLVAVYEEVLK
jgi:hypothetical protein